jgi:DNA-binding beta-propeller fold protein YncE
MNGRENAPDLPADLVAVDRPAAPRLHAGLDGHVVALLFWRLGCVHSRQALADLAALQQEFLGRPFAVVAVHAPVHDGERDEARVRAALAALPGPVTALLDHGGGAMRSFGGAGFPALVLLDAQGRICFRGRGEPNLMRLRDAVVGLLDEAAQQGRGPSAVHVPVPLAPLPGGGLCRPSGLCVHGGELWIADTGHDRVLACDLQTGRVLRHCGSGLPGSDDGPAAVARFRGPMGLASSGRHVFVCDEGNHALRAIELGGGGVATVCGTGRRTTDRHGGAFGVLQGLCSPVGLLAHEGALWVAQAGAHQIWQFDPETQSASAWLGTGASLLRDGGEAAAFSQPWGLCAGDGVLWVADAGNGALRSVELAHTFVRTVDATLQRPVAVAAAGGTVLVADAWRGAVLAYAGGQVPPRVVADRSHGLVEPSALACAGERAFVADAGAGRVFALDLADAAAPLRPFELRDVPAPQRPAPDPRLPRVLGRVALRPFADVTLRLPLPVAGDEQPDPVQPVMVHAANDAGSVLVVARSVAGELADGRVRVVNLPVGEQGDGVLRVEVRLTVRAGATGAPQARAFRFLLPVAVTAGGATEVDASVC